MKTKVYIYFFKELKKYRSRLTKQQYKTIKGQAIAGNVFAAQQGLLKIIKRYEQTDLTKFELKQYRSLKKEIKELEREIDSYKIHDVVKSSANFPYNERFVTVKGYADGWHLRSLKMERVDLKKDCRKIETFVKKINDSQTRRIFNLRYLEGNQVVSFLQIANKIGGGNTADGIRMLHNRYLESHK